MSNYLVITYYEEDKNNINTRHIENMYYLSKKETKKYVLELQKQTNIKYKIYKELFSKVQEKIS